MAGTLLPASPGPSPVSASFSVTARVHARSGCVCAGGGRPRGGLLDISRGCLTSGAGVRTLVSRRHPGGTMSDTKTVGQELQGEILKTVRKSQDAVVDAIQMWADAVQSIKPPLPEVSVPFSDKLPKPSELVTGAYDFAEQLLATQRKFAEDRKSTRL